VREGAKVTVCHVANGNRGHVEIPSDELRLVRRREAREAAALIGIPEVLTLDVPDLEVSASDPAQVRAMVDVVRAARPDVILTHDTEDYMQDHREVSRLVFDAGFSASVPYLRTATPGAAPIVPVLYMDSVAGIGFSPEEYVDITATVDAKLAALELHVSQIAWMREHDGIDFVEFVRVAARYRGIQCGVAFAEAFRSCRAWPRLATRRLLP
jgi:LmbE family N-acetylglucosaminyl deacetylase